MFREYFINRSGSRSNLFQNSIAAFHRQMDQPSHTQARSEKTPHLTYDGLLSFLAHDMVEMLLQFGQLGSEQLPGPSRNFYISSLASDATPTMFAAPQSDVKPLQSLGKYIIVQIVDLWFSMHPLSTLLSKTLLISAIKDETVDPALLAIILADACQMHHGSRIQGALSQEDPEKLAQLAATLLRQRTLPLADADRMPTAQTLMLLGWREMCKGKVRRGTCFIGYTCRIISQIHKAQADEMDVDGIKLNGIAISKVEKEILRNIYWLCLSTTTWSFMQIQQPFSLLLPHEMPEFPYTDETSSALIQLDQASGNISTLHAQIRNMQWLWPLSHITSTVAYTYTLFLNATKQESSPRQEPASWQTQHIHELHRLPQACMDPLVLSRQIRRILLQSIQDVEREITNFTSQSFLLAAYHTIAIQMIFFERTQFGDDRFLLPSMFQSFKQSASALLSVAQRSPPQPTSPVSLSCLAGTGRADAVRTIALGLDTASRALVEIHRQCNLRPTDQEEPIRILHAQLAEYAKAIHQVCRTDHLMRCGSVIQPVKKRLKQLQRSLASGWMASPVTTTGASSSTYTTGSPREVDNTLAQIDGAPWPSLALSSPSDMSRTRDAMDAYFPFGDQLDFAHLCELPGFYAPVSGSGSTVASHSVSDMRHLSYRPLLSPLGQYDQASVLLAAPPLDGEGQVEAQQEPQDASFLPRGHGGYAPSQCGSSDSSVSPKSDADLVAAHHYEGETNKSPSWVLSTTWPNMSAGAAVNEADGLFQS
jgi:hypothetical protein